MSEIVQLKEDSMRKVTRTIVSAFLGVLLVSSIAVAESALFAKIDRTTLSILAEQYKDNPVLSDHPGKPRWVPVVVEARPAYDHETQRLVRTEVVALTEVRRSFDVVNLTAKELQERVDPLRDLVQVLITNGVVIRSDLSSVLKDE